MSADDSSPWVCGECSLPEEGGRMLRQACHHCGKVLCDRCRRYVDDEAFTRRLLAPRHRIVHCSTCRSRHHPRLRSR